MQIISRLIIKEWFKTLIGAVIVLFLLITTADLINGFLQGKPFSRVFLEYSLKMPDLMGKMFPISCLIASLFSLNKLKAHSELISILASGFSYFKFYFIISICASFMVFLQFTNLGFIEPFANKVKRLEIQKSKKSEGKYLTRSSLEGGRFWYKTNEYFTSFSYFNKKNKTIHDLELFYFSKNSRISKVTKAKMAKFINKEKWQLKEVEFISNLDTSTFPLHSQIDNSFISLSEAPEDLKEFEADLSTLNFFKLYQFITKLKKSAINVTEFEIMLLNKIFLSFVCLVFSLLPLTTLFNPNRRNSSFGKIAIQTLLISFVFWGSYSSVLALGNEGKLPPLVATGSVPFLFLSFVLVNYWRNRKLTI
jgi:lipopolysaccharide export system permease protein